MTDILAPDLRIVICGADEGPKLFEMLHRIGLTPRQLEKPEELLEFRIGLTDIVKQKGEKGANSEGSRELRRKIRDYAPGMLVFNGKQPAKDYLDMPTSSFGPQKYTIGATKIFVCPSTRTSSDPRWWDLMAKLA